MQRLLTLVKYAIIICDKITIRRYDNGTETGEGFYPHYKYKLQAKYLPVREGPL